MLPTSPLCKRWASLPFGRTSFPFLYHMSARSLHLAYIHEIGRTPPSPAAALSLLIPATVTKSKRRRRHHSTQRDAVSLDTKLAPDNYTCFPGLWEAPSAFFASVSLIFFSILLSLFRHPFRRAISFSIMSTYLMYFCASTGMMDMMYCIS